MILGYRHNGPSSGPRRFTHRPIRSPKPPPTCDRVAHPLQSSDRFRAREFHARAILPRPFRPHSHRLACPIEIPRAHFLGLEPERFDWTPKVVDAAERANATLESNQPQQIALQPACHLAWTRQVLVPLLAQPRCHMGEVEARNSCEATVATREAVDVTPRWRPGSARRDPCDRPRRGSRPPRTPLPSGPRACRR